LARERERDLLQLLGVANVAVGDLFEGQRLRVFLQLLLELASNLYNLATVKM
jgi:hypothetical protein